MSLAGFMMGVFGLAHFGLVIFLPDGTVKDKIIITFNYDYLKFMKK